MFCMEIYKREKIATLKEYIRKQDSKGNWFTQGIKMVLLNRNISVIFNVNLHIACRYPYLYENFKINKGKKCTLNYIFF